VPNGPANKGLYERLGREEGASELLMIHTHALAHHLSDFHALSRTDVEHHRKSPQNSARDHIRKGPPNRRFVL